MPCIPARIFNITFPQGPPLRPDLAIFRANVGPPPDPPHSVVPYVSGDSKIKDCPRLSENSK